MAFPNLAETRGSSHSRRDRVRAAWKLSLPRQHGAWAALVASFAIGVLDARTLGRSALLMATALTAAFLARQGWARYFRLDRKDWRRGTLAQLTIVLLAVSITTGGLTMLIWQRWYLLAFGGAGGLSIGWGVWSELRRADRTPFAEALGMIGLSLALPATSYAISGSLSGRTWAVWAVVTMFFVGSISRVRYLASLRAAFPQVISVRWRRGGASALLHAVMVATSGALTISGNLSHLWLLAWAPTVVGVWWAVLIGRGVAPGLRRIGFEETAQTVVFVVTAAAIAAGL